MSTLRIHYLQHVPFEGLGSIAGWVQRHHHSLSVTPFFQPDHALPPVGELDWLIVLGGPMSVHDERTYPWLTEERTFIGDAIRAGKVVIGICLGAQLIAHVLGARVYRNAEKEIGWFPVQFSGPATSLLGGLPGQMTVFHWHGDTFELPEGALHFARTDTCAHQAFLYRQNVLGLQFHLEATPETVRQMLLHGSGELVEGPSIQTAREMLAQDFYSIRSNRILYRLLDGLWGAAAPGELAPLQEDTQRTVD